jgi:hypothetical protein
MAQVSITKQAAAQRQIDAAIRIQFGNEDPLAVHTIVSAAHRVLTDLDNNSARKSLELYEAALSDLLGEHPGAPIPAATADFREWLQRGNRRGANFLKHAERDSGRALDISSLTTDHLLLEACSLYQSLGLEPTHEMRTYVRWHLAVYPNFEDVRISTSLGDLSDLDREQQLAFGAYLLESASGR